MKYILTLKAVIPPKAGIQAWCNTEVNQKWIPAFAGMTNAFLSCTKRLKIQGFTLIEVLLALAIISIAFSALFLANSETIKHTQTLKTKTLKHWVAMQGINMIQLGLLQSNTTGFQTQKTTLLNQDWYWRANIQTTPIPSVDRITITVSSSINGPFTDPLDGFRYHEPTS